MVEERQVGVGGLDGLDDEAHDLQLGDVAAFDALVGEHLVVEAVEPVAEPEVDGLGVGHLQPGRRRLLRGLLGRLELLRRHARHDHVRRLLDRQRQQLRAAPSEHHHPQHVLSPRPVSSVTASSASTVSAGFRSRCR
ncbi:MAG: hypothetical protein R3F59_36325 [Myxococcota bacterium]